MTVTFPNLNRMQYPQFGPLGGLIGAWSPGLTGYTGGQVIDLSGVGRNGTISGADESVWYQAGGKTCMNFDGTDDHIALPLFVVPTGAGTLSAWWSPNETMLNSGVHVIFRAQRNSPLRIHDMNYYDSGGFTNYYCGWYNNANDDRAVFVSATPVIGTWYHVVSTWRNGGKQLLYVDGKHRASIAEGRTVDATWDTTTSTYIQMGSDNATWSKSRQDDWLLYNRVLSDDEVALLYSLGRGGWAKQKRRMASGFTAAAPPTFTGKTFKALRLAR